MNFFEKLKKGSTMISERIIGKSHKEVYFINLMNLISEGNFEKFKEAIESKEYDYYDMWKEIGNELFNPNIWVFPEELENEKMQKLSFFKLAILELLHFCDINTKSRYRIPSRKKEATLLEYITIDSYFDKTNQEIAKFLIEHGAIVTKDIIITLLTKKNLKHCPEDEDSEYFKMLIEKFKNDNEFLTKTLYQCTSFGFPEYIKYLLSINVVPDEDTIYIAINLGYNDVVNVFLSHYSNSQLLKDKLFTRSVICREYDIANKLIDMGANVNTRGGYPLIYALVNEEESMVEYLITMGADLSFVKEFTFLQEGYRNQDILRILRSNGLNV